MKHLQKIKNKGYKMECPRCRKEMSDYTEIISDNEKKMYICQTRKCEFFGITRVELKERKNLF